MNEILQTWWPIVVTLISLAALALAFWVRTEIDTKIDARCFETKIEKAIATESAARSVDHKQIVDHDRRIIAIEQGFHRLPDKEDLHKLSLQVATMDGKLGAMNVRIEDLGKSSTANGAKLDRLEQQFYNREEQKT